MSDDPTVNTRPHSNGNDSLIINEAADWLVKLEEGPLSDKSRSQLERWRRQSSKHERAWNAILELQGLMETVPGKVGKTVLRRKRYDRRMILSCLAAMLLAGPAATIAYRQQPLYTNFADLRTNYGQQKTTQLPDGSQIVLNTATAVNVHFDEHKRHLKLIQGELLIQTASDPEFPARPFTIETLHGTVTALGTRFIIRHLPDSEKFTEVLVLEHAVAIDTFQSSSKHIIQAGFKTKFNSISSANETAMTVTDGAWIRRQIIAENMWLSDLVSELNRYHAGILRCEPAVADMKISGVFNVDDVTQALTLVEETLPVRVNRIGKFWMTVVPGN